MPSVRVFLDHPSLRTGLSAFEKEASRLLAKEGAASRRTDIVLSGDSLLRKLNKKFRRKDKPTDVLSFAFNEPGFLGEIYISLDRAKKQAREYGLSFRDEIRRLMVHGLFHLLGYTHYRKKTRSAMEKKESVYL